MKTIEETYRERLKILIDEYGSQAELSAVINKSPAQISQWLNATPSAATGKPRSLKSDTAREIEKATGKPYAWFDQPINEVEEANNLPDGYIQFEVLDIEAQLGTGIVNAEHIEVVDLVTVAESWARKHLGNNLSKIRIITAIGDSMESTIHGGDVLFIDESVRYFDGEGIYIIHTPDGLRAKRLHKTALGHLNIISDNPKYPIESYKDEAEINQIIICGKVKGAWALAEFK